MNTLMSREVQKKSKVDWRKLACSTVLYTALAIILILAIPAAISFACIAAVWKAADSMISAFEKKFR